uniref:Uncharacterized protein n=1 Tax=Knipowitschia caucasica TaxID=637954 RepID=A0AAV2JNC2_KNICA
MVNISSPTSIDQEDQTEPQALTPAQTTSTDQEKATPIRLTSSDPGQWPDVLNDAGEREGAHEQTSTTAPRGQTQTPKESSCSWEHELQKLSHHRHCCSRISLHQGPECSTGLRLSEDVTC